MASYPEYSTRENFYSANPFSAEYPTENKPLKETMNRQFKNAADYRSGIQKEQEAQFRPVEAQGRQQLAQGMRDTSRDFNRRGLMNSGKRIGAQQSQKYGTEAALNNARYNINQGVLGNADALEAGGITTGYNIAGSNPNLGGLAGSMLTNSTNQQIQNQQAQSQLYSSIFGTGAQLAGYGLAGSSKPAYLGQGPTAPGSMTGIGSLSNG